MRAGSFTISESCTTASHPTKRAPDAGDSGAIPSIFLRLSIFPVGRRSAAPAPARVTQTVGRTVQNDSGDNQGAYYAFKIRVRD